MFKVGLTGGIGSGKSVVARMFQVLGVPVFASDDAAKKLLDEDAAVRAAVMATFGEQLYASGALDRKALAARVFGDTPALARLNAIVHPAVRSAFLSWAAAQQAPYVVNEAAILIESGAAQVMDQVIVVSAPEEERIRRVMRRDGTGEEQVRARMRHQLSEAERCARADAIISNDGRTLVIPQVLALHERLSAMARA